MKKIIFCVLSLLVVCSVCHANLLFKMNADTTDLVPGEQITVTVSAKAEGAASNNGLFAWGFDALVDMSGVVEIVDGSIQFLAPTPWDDGTEFESFNQVVTGGTGSIEYMRLQGDLSLYENSSTGADVYTPIAQFDIKAIGSISDSVEYSLGGDNFGGTLADAATLLPGSFQSEVSQNVFTIVPEPATLLMLGLGMVVTCRRKK